MDIWKFFAGLVKVKISAASVAQLITRISNAGIDLMDVVSIDDFTIEATVMREDIDVLNEIAQKHGEAVKIMNKRGLYWLTKRIKSRKLLVIGITIILFLTAFLPTRILFVQVEGNSNIPSNYIIEIAQSSGVAFGTSRRKVRSEKIKNKLLEKIPELQWTGINTYGCVALISVKERSTTSTPEKSCAVSNIVALQDGVIEQCTVLQGNSLCKVGQSVKKGQVLVSGYVDCGRYVKAVRAEAEIYASTLRKTEIQTPRKKSVRCVVLDNKTNYSLLFGKNFIKLSQDSGISSSGCVKMYETKYLTLPGGFSLPLALVIEHYKDYACQTDYSNDSDSCEWMYDFSEKYLRDHMVAGRIISSNLYLEPTEDTFKLCGSYICSEMIGQVKSEEIIQYDEKND